MNTETQQAKFNMEEGLSIAEARNRLTQLPEELGNSGALTVTRRGKPVLAVMSYDLFESITETLEIMTDPEQMAILRQSVREANDGRTVKWQNVKNDLRL